mmetsp:Transcript_124397/g.265088  ORF Transcript_124397/g.265088 Transcript_124397/m.265088 type:complete len:301 (+) Transcript_124397:130-1032(+)
MRRVACRLLVLSQVQALEVRDGLEEPLTQLHSGLPIQILLCPRDVRPALLRVVSGKGQIYDLALAPRELNDHLRQLLHCKLVRVANVHRPMRLLLVHEANEGIHGIFHEAEGSCLRSVTVNGDVLIRERLHDEVAHNAAVVRVHAWPVRVEDAGQADVDVVAPEIIEAKGLRDSLTLVITGAHADGVHVAPVLLLLWGHFRVTVDLARGGLQKAGVDPLGQAEHVVRPKERHLRRLDWVELVVDGRRRASHVEDHVALGEEWLCHIMADELKSRVPDEVANIGPLAREVVVEAHDLVALG